jgi:hypothetical protein
MVAPAAVEPGHLIFDTSRLKLAVDSSPFEQRGRWGGGGRRNDGARAAIVLGTLASITGAALLVYANRPECRGNERANGCGYGTKVVGGAVLTGGMIGIIAGAVSWR